MIKLRPSSSSRWIACPASVKLSEGIPNTPSGEAAQIGTAIHAVAETCYLTGTSPDEYIGKVVEGITITEENARFAYAHVDHIRQLELDMGTLKVEQFVTAYKGKEVTLGGTADVIAYSFDKDTLVIADLKTGRGFVDADSDQMKIYAIGAMAQLKTDFTNIELRIIQPHHGEPRIHKLTYKELNEWAATYLTPSIKAIVKGETTPTPSEKACQWCPAKATCPAHVEEFNEVAAQDIKRMHDMTDEQIGIMLSKVTAVEDYIKALREYATQKIETGSVIVGWQMQPKRAQRKWKDENKAVEVLMQAGIEKSKLYTIELISPSEASKLLSKENKVLLDDITEKKSSGLTLARAVGLGQ